MKTVPEGRVITDWVVKRRDAEKMAYKVVRYLRKKYNITCAYVYDVQPFGDMYVLFCRDNRRLYLVMVDYVTKYIGVVFNELLGVELKIKSIPLREQKLAELYALDKLSMTRPVTHVSWTYGSCHIIQVHDRYTSEYCYMYTLDEGESFVVTSREFVEPKRISDSYLYDWTLY